MSRQINQWNRIKIPEIDSHKYSQLLGAWDRHTHTHTYIKQIISKNLLYSTSKLYSAVSNDLYGNRIQRRKYILYIYIYIYIYIVVAQLCLTLCDPRDCSMPGFLVLHHLLEFACMCIYVTDSL